MIVVCFVTQYFLNLWVAPVAAVPLGTFTRVSRLLDQPYSRKWVSIKSNAKHFWVSIPRLYIWLTLSVLYFSSKFEMWLIYVINVKSTLSQWMSQTLSQWRHAFSWVSDDKDIYRQNIRRFRAILVSKGLTPTHYCMLKYVCIYKPNKSVLSLSQFWVWVWSNNTARIIRPLTSNKLLPRVYRNIILSSVWRWLMSHDLICCNYQ